MGDGSQEGRAWLPPKRKRVAGVGESLAGRRAAAGGDHPRRLLPHRGQGVASAQVARSDDRRGARRHAHRATGRAWSDCDAGWTFRSRRIRSDTSDVLELCGPLVPIHLIVSSSCQVHCTVVF